MFVFIFSMFQVKEVNFRGAPVFTGLSESWSLND